MSTVYEQIKGRIDGRWGSTVADLHEQLLAAASWAAAYNSPGAERTIRAVVERHAPMPCPGPSGMCWHLEEHTVCSTCRDGSLGGAGRAEYPCDETSAIASALGVEP